ncbi:MAG: maleylpyruvate isomerase N-terminal domain-containing protein [Chloroflexi bacterium]|nr:maleylpyruvate isomerase N-terminal domain-containing protein [Chloroflexota bacterium]MBV9598945.1 maleylpyruvate isomerase N-terminal domain-containing protein [Chloroflexota bacterium]
MATGTTRSRVNVMDYSGKEFLLNLDRAERAEFYKLLDEAPWEGATASGHWQVRDLCGHLIDVTEGYLERFAMERAGQEAPAPLGLTIMASRLDEHAQAFRALSKEQAITRLKTASDKLFEIFDALDEKQWSGEMVPHTYMGPLPACFFAAFQLIDYSIHAWDIKVGLGRDEPLSDDAALTLIPFMLIVIQYTVDADRAADLKCKFGINIEGSGGGSWAVDVDGTTVNIVEGSTEGCETIFDFDPNDFVLSTYQRRRGGRASGNLELADKVRDLLFKI